MLNITDTAHAKLTELMQHHPSKLLRIVMEGFG